jgi:hypothetical protein
MASKLASLNVNDAQQAHSLRGGNSVRESQYLAHGADILKESRANVNFRSSFSVR